MSAPVPARPAERGSVTVEFALALPVVAALVVVSVGAVLVAAVQVRLQVAAATASRALGRGDADAASEAVRAAGAVDDESVRRTGGLVCVELARAVALGVPPPLSVSATACAADGGR